MTHGHADRFPVGSSFELAVRGDGPGVVVVREDDCRSDEDTVLKHRGLVHKGMILQLAVVTHGHPGAHIGSAADDASGPQPGPFPYLGKRPDGRALAQHDIISNFSTSVNSHGSSWRWQACERR